MNKLFASLLIVVMLASLGCTSMNRTQQGALSGGAIGAAVGGGISYLTGGRFIAGALLGGAIGAVGGGIYGHEQDEHPKKHRTDSATH